MTNRLPEVLRGFRVRYDLSQRGLARMLGVSQAAVATWEQAKRIPGVKVMSRICGLTRCRLEEIIDYRG